LTYFRLSPARFVLGTSLLFFLLLGLSGTSGAAEKVKVLLTNSGQLDTTLRPERPLPDGPMSLRAFLTRLSGESGTDIEIVQGVPLVRAIRTAETAELPTCVPFIIRNRERGQFLKYSEPLIATERIIVVYRKDNAAVAAVTSFNGLLGTPSLSLAWRHGASFGADLDMRFHRFRPEMVGMSSAQTKPCALVAGKRASYCLTSKNALNEMLRRGVIPAETMSYKELPDAPLIEPDRLGCNGATPDAFLEAANRLLHGAE